MCIISEGAKLVGLPGLFIEGSEFHPVFRLDFDQAFVPISTATTRREEAPKVN